jgi:signal transduction histidine kinase
VAIGTGEYVDEFENELKKKLLEKIKDIRFGDNGYIFIYDTEGNCLSHYNQKLIGKNRLNYQDKNGNFLVKDVLNYTKNNKSGFMTYIYPIQASENTLSTPKVSYLKQFEDWNWIIGSGFYLDNLNKEIKEKETYLFEKKNKALKGIIYTSIILTFLFSIISYFLSKYLEIIFNQYKKSLKEEINLKVEKEKMLIQQSKMATMGEMIGNIAHQWKQPLSLISMSNGLLKLNQDVKDFSSKEDIDEAIDNIDVSVKHLSTTIDDFRNFFKPDKEKKDYSLKTVFEKTLKLISSQFKNNNIEIIKNIEDTKLHGYPNEFLQVLINIIKNAKDELVKLEKDRLLFIYTFKEDDNIIIKIKDNAGGIPENIIDKIFEPYFTTKSEDEGTGIGLYMSKQIIEGMNGKLSVVNCEYDFKGIKYKGAEFILELRLKERD